uniref:Uncharacterized protein n=1 Tax=Lactuca sativa TaxID=4236 RepID=A0A9R1VDH3_LACSA|nr:hypothetical protein LSAT_V11C500254890 [Lactuca sativa]
MQNLPHYLHQYCCHHHPVPHYHLLVLYLPQHLLHIHPYLHHLPNHLYLHLSNHIHLHLLHHLYLDPQQIVVNRLRKMLAFNIKGIYLDLQDWMGVYILECKIRSPCSSVIYESFGERDDLNGYSWAALSDETKLLYWDKFHKCGHPGLQDGILKTSKKKSEQNKKNRRRGVADGQALSTHTGGSASHSKIASNLKKLWGHDPAHHELFLYTHTKNHDGVTFLVDKAKKSHDDFMERCDWLEAIGEEIDEDKLFYDVRLYGFGSYGKRIRSSKGYSEMHREQYEDNNAETKVEIENLKKLVETQCEQYEDIQQKYEDVQQKYEDAQKKNVEFQQKNVDVQAKFEQQLAQAMNVINTLSEHVKNFINR